MRHKWQRTLEARAARLGATVDWGHADESLTLDAPEGQVWSCDDLHGLVATWSNGRERCEALLDLWERADYGLESCPVESCDICEEA